MFQSVQIVPAVSEEASGPSYSVVKLTESILAQGIGTRLYALDWSPMRNRPSFLKTFAVGPGPRKLGNSPKMKRWLTRQTREGNISVLHSHGMWMMPNIYPAWLSRKYNVPLVTSPRGSLSQWSFRSGSIAKKLLWPLLQKNALEATTCFHATSYTEYEDIRRMGLSSACSNNSQWY